MKKIISIIVMLFLIFNTLLVNAYNISEWADAIESVISELDWSDYTFKYNEWSSADASYYVFYKWNMVWYIYATDDWITLWDWWDSNWELGIFFNQKDLSIDEIVARFYTDKNPLWESVLESNIYSCSWDSKEFFSCLSNYTNQDKNSEWLIYLFDGDIEKDIIITTWDVIKYESIDWNWIKKECEISNDKKDEFLEMLSRWENWAFSNKDFDYAICTETVINNTSNSNLEFDFGDIIGLDANSNNIDIKNTSFNENTFTIDFTESENEIDSLIEKDLLPGIDNKSLNNKILNTTSNNDITYQDGLDIINDTNKRLNDIDKSMEDNSLYEQMMLYRKMWNNIKIEDEKNIEWKEWLRIKYLHKKIEEKYKALFKEYVLTKKKNSSINKDTNLENKIDDTKEDKFDDMKEKNTSITESKKDYINKDLIISDNLLNNFKTLFKLLNDKYNNWNYSLTEKKGMESLFSKVDKKNNFEDINDYLSKDSSFLNNEYNLDLLQKLMIIMCAK